jgi:hypothetical protein
LIICLGRARYRNKKETGEEGEREEEENTYLLMSEIKKRNLTC